MKILNVVLIAAIALFMQCKQAGVQKDQEIINGSVQKYAANQYQLQALLWYQTSGELIALYHQGYSLARLMLDKKLPEKKRGKQKKLSPALIVDIDETILNNSPFQGMLLQRNTEYSDSLWLEWIKSAKAEALPGALEFLKYAESKGVTVFYLSNRYEGAQKEKTRQNLERLGFPNTRDTSFMLFRNDVSSKEARRTEISKNYEILLLCGDNLSDFSYVFDNRDKNNRIDSVDKYRHKFGETFIVLPNPMYGDWEKFIWKDLKNLSPIQKDSLRYSFVKGIN